jgi:primosomal protein N'
MYLYRVVPEVKVPSTWLTYSSQTPLTIGQLVYIPLRTKTVLGLVIDTVQGEYAEAKSVGELFPIVLASNYLRFLYLFSYNTLNDYNNIIAIVAGWMSKLNQKQLKILSAEYQLLTQVTNSSENKNIEAKNPNTKSIDYSIVKEQWVRIRVIIRSLISDERSDPKSPPKIILVLLPEKSQLSATKDQLVQEFGSTATISRRPDC